MGRVVQRTVNLGSIRDIKIHKRCSAFMLRTLAGCTYYNGLRLCGVQVFREIIYKNSHLAELLYFGFKFLDKS